MADEVRVGAQHVQVLSQTEKVRVGGQQVQVLSQTEKVRMGGQHVQVLVGTKPTSEEPIEVSLSAVAAISADAFSEAASTANLVGNATITIVSDAPSGGTSQIKTKDSGSFTAQDIYAKSGGSFINIVHKYKTGGNWVPPV